jgi:hypothetical protein
LRFAPDPTTSVDDMRSSLSRLDYSKKHVSIQISEKNRGATAIGQTVKTEPKNQEIPVLNEQSIIGSIV